MAIALIEDGRNQHYVIRRLGILQRILRKWCRRFQDNNT
jgi:transposase-like protein